MLIFGHDLIESEVFARVHDIPSIALTKPNQIVLLESITPYIATIKYCNDNDIHYGVFCPNIQDTMFANALNAKYLIVEQSVAKEIQDIATEYLFDAKVLVLLDKQEAIEDIAKLGIDGVLFQRAIEG